MKNIVVLALSLWSFGLFAQNENALLYKVSGNGIEKPSYIFGTIHITCDAKLDPSVMKALDATSQMYLELDMDDPAMQAEMMKMINMKDGVTVSSLISAEDFALLDKYLMEKMKVPAKMLDTYKPFILSSMFMTSLLDCTPQSIEGELMRVSAEQKEEVFGLETVEDQMTVFDKIPYQLQAEELIKSIKNDFADDKLEIELMLKSYATKDLNELQRLANESESTMMKDYSDLLLNNRNANWIPIIERISKKQPTFFGVGAAHLYGNQGVINLLRQKGYNVQAIMN